MTHALEDLKNRYAPDDDLPLGGFAILLATYVTVVASGAFLTRRLGYRLPERFTTADLAIGALATHKISRTIAKASVTAPIRAPFTEFDGPAGAAELNEHVKGTGLRKAVGELITCPFCLGQWTSTAVGFGLVVAPRPTRWITAVFAMKAGSDFLQLKHAGLHRQATGG
jgi:hypothetical protein